jgi:hypothetical protein
MGKRALTFLIALCLTGCSFTWPLRPPVPSGLRYEASPAPRGVALVLVDQRPQSERDAFSTGRLDVHLELADAPLDAARFLAEHVQAELASRGLTATVTPGMTGTNRIELRTFRMQNWRTNAYTPFINGVFLSADLLTPAGRQRIGVFVWRGKVPMWTLGEVVEPTVNEPMSVAVKEFSSKLANALYGYRAPDAKVRELVTRIDRGRDDSTWLDVYSLGFSNNPLAIETLARLARDESEYVRIGAISGLGTLRATKQLKLLSDISADSDVAWQDRAMAYKAIGDLGVPESEAFLRSAKTRLESENDFTAQWWKQVLALYL